MRNIILLLAAIAIGVTACRKKPDPVTTPQIIDNGGVTVNDGHLKLSFANIVGDEPLVLNDKAYMNANGDSFKVSNYRYYVSNIKLTREDGTAFNDIDGYYLVNQSDASSMNITLHEVPAGNYNSITFLLGVDSARNVTGAQTGALDPINGMYWAWLGYIATKLEGQYKQGSADYMGFLYHIGGYQEPQNNMKWITLTLPENAVVGTHTSNIHITSDVAEWFKTPVKINFANYNNIMDPGKEMSALVSNYIDMFKANHVEN